MITSGVSFDATTSSLVQNHARNQKRVDVAIEQLSTGKRINRPSDDPSGWVAAEEIRGELRELQSEGRAASFRRINALREHTAWSNVQARMQAEQVRQEQSPAQSDGGETPFNIDPGSVTDLPYDHTASFAADSRIDQVFTHLREDKEVILTETLSQIEDTDFAAATAELAQGQVLTEAAIVALAYATQQLTDQFAELMDTIDVVVE
jgi:flagellin